MNSHTLFRAFRTVAVGFTLAVSAGSLRAEEPQLGPRLFYLSEQVTVIKDPFGDIPVKINKEHLRPVEDFVRMAPRLRPDDEVLAESSDARAVDRLRSAELKLLDTRVIAWATNVAPQTYPEPTFYYQCMLMCRYGSGASDERSVAVVCYISGPTGNLAQKWMIGEPFVPLFKPVLIVDWPPTEEQLVDYLPGTNFGLRNHLLDRGSICIITSYLPKYKRWNRELQVEPDEREKRRLLDKHIRAVGRPVLKP